MCYSNGIRNAAIWIITALLLSLHVLVWAHPYNDRFSIPKCSDTQTGRELLVGEAFTRPGQCIRVQCLGTLDIWEDSCQTPALKGNCTRLPVANIYLEYPHCCPLYECKSYEVNQNGEVEETRIYDQQGGLRKTEITQVFVISEPIKGNVPGSGLKTKFEI